MRENLFKKKIVCGYCLSGHKTKLERGKRKFVCSQYDNYKNCKRNLVSQEQLLELLDMRYKRLLTKEEIEILVNHIIVTEERIEIKLNDDKSIILSQNFAQF